MRLRLANSGEEADRFQHRAVKSGNSAPGKTNPEASGKLRDSQRLAYKRANEPAGKAITQREAH